MVTVRHGERSDPGGLLHSHHRSHRVLPCRCPPQERQGDNHRGCARNPLENPSDARVGQRKLQVGPEPQPKNAGGVPGGKGQTRQDALYAGRPRHEARSQREREKQNPHQQSDRGYAGNEPEHFTGDSPSLKLAHPERYIETPKIQTRTRKSPREGAPPCVAAPFDLAIWRLLLFGGVSCAPRSLITIPNRPLML